MILVSMCIGYPIFESRIGGRAVALTDLLVLLYLPVLIYRTVFRATIPALKFWFGSAILLFTFLVAILVRVPQDGFLSVLGWCRPALLFVTIIILLTADYAQQLKVIEAAFYTILALMILACFGGLFCYFILDIPTALVMIRPYYLGFWPIQSAGLDGHPNGAAQIIFLSFWCLMWLQGRPSNQHKLTPLVWLSLLTTFSKSLLIYLSVLFYFTKPQKKGFWLVATFLIGTYLFLSHSYPVQDTKGLQQEHELYLIPDAPLFKVGSYTFYQTTYSANKIASWSAFRSKPVFGVGPRNYLPYVEQLQRDGLYPSVCRFLNPHCTYTSILARFGMVGFGGLIFFIVSTYYMIRSVHDPRLRTLFAGFYLVMALDAVTSDLEYHRLFWFVNAWLMVHLSAQPLLAHDHEQQAAQ